MTHYRLLSAILLLTTFSTISSSRPTVGLVLSGGGAKGIAHAGVIQALEDHGIPVDYVAGTSMGAVVGGLYCCGYSPADMMTLFKSKGFRNWSMGSLDQSDLWEVAKPAPIPSWFEFSFSRGDKKKLKIDSNGMPGSLISPLPMNIEFLELFSPYCQLCQGDFDKLFVPLRTVTSDIYHKRKVVCSKGILADAVRSSMSFPMVYKPITMDSVLMFDGGIYDNFPVDVMHEDFDPDFIVGISVSIPDAKPQQNNLYSQLQDLIIQRNDYDLPEEYGVKIQVPVQQYNVLEFNDADAIYAIGYQKGEEMADSICRRLSKISPDFKVDKSETAKRRAAFKSRLKDVYFSSGEAIGTTPKETDIIVQSFFQGRDSINLKDVKEAYYYNLASDKYTDLVPLRKVNGDSTLLSLTPDMMGEWRLRVGGLATTSTQSRLFLSAGYHPFGKNPLSVDLNGWLGQTYQAGSLFFRCDLPVKYKAYFELGGVMSREKLYDTDVFFYESKVPDFAISKENFLRVAFRKGFSTVWMASVEGSYGYLKSNYYSGNQYDDRYDSSIHAWKAALKLEQNTFDNDMYPMYGTNVKIKAEGSRKKETGSGKWHNQLDLSAAAAHYFPIGQYFSLGAGIEGAYRFGKPWQNYIAALVQSTAFAPTPAMKGYFNCGFRNPSYLAAGISPVFSPLHGLQFRGDFYGYTKFKALEEDPETMLATEGDSMKKAEFAAQISALYNFRFATLCIYGNYLTSPHDNWNFGLSLGILIDAPKF